MKTKDAAKPVVGVERFSSFVAPPTTLNKRFFFIRHGESILGEHGLYEGVSDSGLSKLGKKQAKSTAKQLRQLQKEMACDLVFYSSPLMRAIESASYCKTVDFVLPFLKEKSFGVFEGKPKDLAKKFNPNTPYPKHNIEAFKNWFLKGANSPLFFNGDGIFVFWTHSGFMKEFLSLSKTPANCEIIEVELSDTVNFTVVNGEDLE